MAEANKGARVMDVLYGIDVHIVDNHVVIPRGMVPVFVKKNGYKTTAYVKEWTAEMEYDSTKFSLYPLDEAGHYLLTGKGQEIDQEWYHGFNEPTREASELHDGKLDIREQG